MQGAPPLPKEEGEYIITIPAEGILRTSSPEQYGWAHDRYYYYSGQTMRSLPDSGEAAMIWGKLNGEAWANQVNESMRSFWLEPPSSSRVRAKKKALLRDSKPLSPPSEEQSGSQHEPMIVSVELRSRNLHSAAKNQSEPVTRVALQFEVAQHQSRCHKILHVAVIRSAVVEGCIALDFRPEEFDEVILRNRIPGHCTTQFRGVTRRQNRADT